MSAEMARVLTLAWEAMVRRHRIDNPGSLAEMGRAARVIVARDEGSLRLLNDCAAWIAVYEAAS